MKLAFFEIESWEKEVLTKSFPKDNLLFSTSKLTIKNVDKYKDTEILSVFIYSQITDKLLAQMPKLKLIATRSTGFNHIDLASCKKRQIPVCYVPTYGENTVAEHAFALILALSRKIVSSVERTKQGSFDLTGLRGFDLKNHTLGVIGSGSIGKHVIRMAKGFEMNLLVFDVYPDKVYAKQMGFSYVSLDELLKKADIVTIHVPYNKNTFHLIGKEALAKMKPTAYLINTSRGELVDTDALVKALKSNRLAGAGLDVLEEECHMMEERALLTKEFSQQQCNLKTLLENHVLLTMPNVLITPHNAFNTQEALTRILDTTISNITGFKNKKLINVVTN